MGPLGRGYMLIAVCDYVKPFERGFDGYTRTSRARECTRQGAQRHNTATHARTACTRVARARPVLLTGHPSNMSVSAPSHEESDGRCDRYQNPLMGSIIEGLHSARHSGGVTRGIGVMCTSQALIPRAHAGP